MITTGGKTVSAIYIGGRALSAVYKGAVLVWTAVRSCFGSGWWNGAKPWIGTDGWKSN